MRLELTSESRVLIELRAGGPLGMGHMPTLSAHPDPWTIDVGEGAIDAVVDLRFAAAAIQPPTDIADADKLKILENACGRDVLDAARFQAVNFHGRYAGTLAGGSLDGDLELRGARRPVSMRIVVTSRPGADPRGPDLDVRGVWEGRLTQLGIKPFRALLGALRLDDWVRLRLAVTLAVR